MLDVKASSMDVDEYQRACDKKIHILCVTQDFHPKRLTVVTDQVSNGHIIRKRKIKYFSSVYDIIVLSWRTSK